MTATGLEVSWGHPDWRNKGLRGELLQTQLPPAGCLEGTCIFYPNAPMYSRAPCLHVHHPSSTLMPSTPPALPCHRLPDEVGRVGRSLPFNRDRGRDSGGAVPC